MSDEVTLRREGKDKNLKAPTLKQNRLKEGGTQTEGERDSQPKAFVITLKIWLLN